MFKLVMETDGTNHQSSEEVDKALIYKPYPSYNYFDNYAKGVSGLVQFGGKGGYTKKGGSECIVCYENKPNAYSRWCRECNACLCAGCFKKCMKSSHKEERKQESESQTCEQINKKEENRSTDKRC